MRRRLALLAGIAALACAIPARAQDDAAPGAEQRGRPNTSMLVTGSAVFVSAYGASVLVGATSARDTDHDLYIPVAGPFLAAAKRGGCQGPCDAQEILDRAYVVGAGAAQIVGITLVVISFFVPEEKHASARRIRVTPVAGALGGGVAAYGAF